MPGTVEAKLGTVLLMKGAMKTCLVLTHTKMLQAVVSHREKGTSVVGELISTRSL